MRRVLIIITLAAFIVLVVVPPSVAAQEGENDISARFEDVMVLKSRGDYDGAIGELNAIIAEYQSNERALRLAYGYLVAAYHEAGDVEGAERGAMEALERFPDITAGDDITIPPLVDDYYDRLRREMFGSLSIVEPKHAELFLDGNRVGLTPLRRDLVRAGEHDILLVKKGYHHFVKSIVIESDRLHVETIEMKRARTKEWWIKRGAIVALSVVALILLWPDPPQDLSEPPSAP